MAREILNGKSFLECFKLSIGGQICLNVIHEYTFVLNKMIFSLPFVVSGSRTAWSPDPTNKKLSTEPDTSSAL